MWKSRRQPQRFKRKRSTGVLDLAAKVAQSGGPGGAALEDCNDGPPGEKHNASNMAGADGLYGGRVSAGLMSSSFGRKRLFPQDKEVGAPRSRSVSQSRSRSSSRPKSSATQASRTSLSSRHSRFSRNTASSNIYVAAKGFGAAAVHVVCCLSENLARETCVASMDAGSPVTLHVTKQGNGQTYAETLAYLEMLKPDEILLNEGRRTSQLARKVLTLYPQESPDPEATDSYTENEDAQPSRYGGACTSTVVKFVSRAHFDQTKGAELLRQLAREETYDATVVEEYILLSSSNALLHYMQTQLGASIARKSLALFVNAGGNQRMSIDRNTLLQLELLVNSKTGKVKESLVGTIDRTKTTVGSRLLRTNLMSPPTNVDTIHSRLELVDTFLGNQNFFYDTMDHLVALPDVDKMLSSIALIPKSTKRVLNTPVAAASTATEGSSVAESSSRTTMTIASTASSKSTSSGRHNTRTGRTKADIQQQRLASVGIGALVGIKSILSALPAFVSVLQKQLGSMADSRDQGSKEGSGPNSAVDTADDSTIATSRASLLIGLGSGRTAGQAGSTTSSSLPANLLLQAIVVAMSQPCLGELHAAISEIFTETTSYSRNSHAMRHQECFALKSEPNGMLSVLRKAFLANVDDIYRKADEYAEVYDIRVNVKYTTARGYFLAVPSDIASDLPNIFTQPTISGRYIHCTTEEITSLNSRAKDNVHDILLMTHAKIQQVLAIGRENYDAVAALSDGIALLDMCHGFADHVTLNRQQWSRPVVVDAPSSSPDFARTTGSANTSNSQCVGIDSGSTMIIRNGRHGIEVANSAGGNETQVYVPNDTFASTDRCFTIITGINGSGKSTYLKQIAICTVLSHCGSYVPAEQASIPIRDMLCCRIGNADDQEHNISTFLLEMKEIAFICNHVSSKSLVLVDELGRATSNEDGVAIAWSIAEHLLKKGPMTFFVTHFPQLCQLEAVYPTVQNVHLEASMTCGEHTDITYTHKVKAGACSVSAEYGVELAPLCGWPDGVYKEAKNLHQELSISLPEYSLCSPEKNEFLRTFESLNLMRQELNRLSIDESLHTFDATRSKLLKLYEDCCENGSSTDLRSMMERILLGNVASRDAQTATKSHKKRFSDANHNDDSRLDEVRRTLSHMHQTERNSFGGGEISRLEMSSSSSSTSSDSSVSFSSAASG